MEVILKNKSVSLWAKICDKNVFCWQKQSGSYYGVLFIYDIVDDYKIFFWRYSIQSDRD